MEKHEIDGIIPVVDEQDEIIQKQSKIIKKLIHLLLQHISAEEVDQCLKQTERKTNEKIHIPR